MSYLNNLGTRRKTTSVATVALLHVGFGFAIVVGLNPEVQQAVTSVIKSTRIEDAGKQAEVPPVPKEKLVDIIPTVVPPVIVEGLPPVFAKDPQITVQTTSNPVEAGRVAETAPPTITPRTIVRTQISIAEFSKALFKKSRPDFPTSISRQMESDGKTQTVVRGCRVYIGESGRVDKAECVTSEYPALAEKTERWLTGMKFAPATEDGKPVGSWVDQVPAVVWRLED